MVVKMAGRGLARAALEEMRQEAEAKEAGGRDGRKLPIWQHSSRLVKKVEENTVTLVFGSTGNFYDKLET